ncbi:MAG: hypothetical protein WAM07_18105 [Halobacillus sp.]|uniref:hypothetical protein n=1 Tax=Halobacillus sp. TaxID=56800 RepID=UPI003BAE9177
MAIIIELFDGSFDLLFLSLYITLLAGIAFESMWTHMVSGSSLWLQSRHVFLQKDTKAFSLQETSVSITHGLIHWIQRTVARKDDDGDDDHHLFVRA